MADIHRQEYGEETLPLRAVTYCRCSTEEESQRDALVKQRAESRKNVLKQGWMLIDEYIEAKSGTTTEKRKEYNRLYEDLVTDRFDIVVIKSQDRLMRNTKDWYLFIDRLVTNKKRLYMYLEQKFYSADDALITGIKAILAEEYSKELSKKINNAHRHRQCDGKSFILPVQTYGLRKSKSGEIVIVEDEADSIRKMFYLCKTMGCYSIARYLRENGYRDRNGNEYQEETIRRIIRNPLRCGTVIQNTRHYDFQQKRMVKNSESEWIVHKNAVPAIVSEEEWKEANEAMDRRAETFKCRREIDSGAGSAESICNVRGKNPGKYPLSGKIRCGECGSPYYRRYRKRNKDGALVVEWKCRKYIQYGKRGCANAHFKDRELNQILEETYEFYQYEETGQFSDILKQVLELLGKVIGTYESQNQRTQIQKEITRYEVQKEKLLDKLLNEVISDHTYKNKEEEIEKHIVLLKQQLENGETLKEIQLSAKERIEKIRSRLEVSLIKKAVLEDMADQIEKITVFPRCIEYMFQEGYTLTFEKQMAGKKTET